MEVTSTKSIHFPKFDWGINAGAVRELPSDEVAQKAILATKCISKVESKPSTPTQSNKSETKKEDTK